MARRLVAHHSGFSFNYTDLNANVFPPKDSCIFDSLGFLDIDGDGMLDFIAIGTASGDYEDTDHEVMAIHTPTGNILWRALRGEASKKLGLIGEVLVVSTNTGNRLRGLDPRTGRELWNLALEDALEEDGFDGDDRAPAIAQVGGGPWAAYQCVDETSWVIDVRNGQIVKRAQGKLHPVGWNLPGMVGFEAEDSEGNDCTELWDLRANRSVYKVPDGSSSRTLHGAGYFGLMHRSDGLPRGGYGTKVVLFDMQSGQQVGTSFLRDGEDSVEHGETKYGVIGGYLLGGSRVLFGDPYRDEASAFVGQLVPNGIGGVQPLPPPRAGYALQAFAWCSPVMASVWKKAKGTEKLVVVGHDPNTLANQWVADDLGGYGNDNLLHVNTHAILVPKSNDNYYTATNPCCIVHIDPATGAKVTEYPVEATDCVGTVAHFLVGSPDYFSGGVPTIHDTWRRERIL
jgi:hypothetical protein